MKNSVLLFLTLTLSISSYSNALAGNYKEAMKTALSQLDSAKTQEDFQAAANTFERIAKAEPKEWLPLYYSGLTYIYLGFDKSLPAEQRDLYLDQALEHANAANELSENNVEIAVLMGYLKMARLTVNPAERGAYMSPQVSASFQKAVAMDPQNPRALILLARWKYGTAQYFNSSTEEPCAMAAKSISLFNGEPQEAISPHWGKSIAENMLKACTAK